LARPELDGDLGLAAFVLEAETKDVLFPGGKATEGVNEQEVILDSGVPHVIFAHFNGLTVRVA